MRPIRFIAFIAAGFLIVVGCGNNNDTNSTIDEGSASGNIIVYVSDGNPSTQPIYSWQSTFDNSTNAEQISVARTSDLNTPVWGIHSTNVNSDLIQSPWQHGTTGGFVTQFASSEINLTVGVKYRVTVTKAGGSPEGYREFTVTQ